MPGAATRGKKRRFSAIPAPSPVKCTGRSGKQRSASWSWPGIPWSRRVDVVVAVRSFDRRRYPSKPPTKLYNARHAGVPAVLRWELAYRDERRSPLDYCEAGSFAELVTALRQLKADPGLRRDMAANGRLRARESDPAVITVLWRDFFTGVATPAYKKWIAASAREQRAFYRDGGWK